MAWQIKFIPRIEKQLRKIPAQDVQKIFDFLKKQVAKNSIIVLIVKVGHRKDLNCLSLINPVQKPITLRLHLP